MTRRLVQFWAGGRTSKKKETKQEERREARLEGDNKVNESAAVEKAEKFRKGGKVKVKVVHKAKGGMPGAVAGMKHRAAMPPANPMEGRMDTGVVGRRRKPPMPTMGAAMGALGPLGPIR